MEVGLVVLGAALTLIGGVVTHMVEARSADARWLRERDERRLLQAATDLGRARNFLEEFSPDRLVLFFDQTLTIPSFGERVDVWRAISPDIRRLAVIDRSLEDDVDDLISNVVRMLDVTAEGLASLVKNETVDMVEAWRARTAAIELVNGLADRIAQ